MTTKPPDVNEAHKAGAFNPEDTEPMRDPDEGRTAPRYNSARLLSETLADSVAAWKRRARGEERPVPAPWPGLARELGGGLWPGCHVLVGNTGTGKTQFALQLALHAASKGVPVCYVGLELDQAGHDARLLGLELGRKWSAIYLGEDKRTAELRSEEELLALKRLEGLPYRSQLSPPHGWDYQALPALAEELRAAHPDRAVPILIVLDYLQLVGGEEREIRERIGRAAYLARGVAREHNAAVLLLSSTARTNYGTLEGEEEEEAKEGRKSRGKKAPLLGHGNPARLVGLGKESGETEYSADSVLVLGREPWPVDAATGRPTPPPNGSTVWLAAAKVRAKPEGATGWVELLFNGSRFEEADNATAHQRRTI